MEENILRYTNIYPFHMPGHKRNKNFIDGNLLDLDLTEVAGLDNLHSPSGIIGQAQKKCAEIFGSRHSFFIVNGGSCAVMAAVFSVCEPGDEIIIARNSHKSVYNAIELSGAVPLYLYSDYMFGILCAIDYRELENLLCVNKNVKAVFVTSPSYEGFCLDIKLIADIVHSYRKILIVDEAHGSHFVFHHKFPQSAIKSGADIVVNSLHKTLPCLTQSALLHINNDSIDISRVKRYLSMFQTTSPSYIAMAVIDKMLKKVSQPLFFNDYVKKIFVLRHHLSHNKVLKLIDSDDIKSMGYAGLDPTKLTFLMNTDRNIDMEKILRDDFFIQIEMSLPNYFVAISTIADMDIGFNMLENAIDELEKKFPYRYLPPNKSKSLKVKSVFPPNQMLNKKKKLVPLEKSFNEISADYIIPYPPGIPLLVPGEVMNQEVVECINFYFRSGVNLLGLNKGLVSVLEK